jgi:hypothetical protein
VSHVAVGVDDDELLGDQRVAVNLRLVAILTDVVRSAHLTGFLIQRPNEAIAGTHDQQFVHDRGTGKHSTAGIEVPEQLELS